MTTSQPVILIIDDDPTIGRVLKRLAERSFPDHHIYWVKNGIAGVQTATQYADRLRLVVLDIAMDLMDGNMAAVQIRTVAPRAPIMPFTAHRESLPALVEMGCVLPVVKSPEAWCQMPDLMRQAMNTPVSPMLEGAWTTALQQSGDAVLRFVSDSNLRALLSTDRNTVTAVQRAIALIDKYRRRIGMPPAREIQQARRALEEVAVS